MKKTAPTTINYLGIFITLLFSSLFCEQTKSQPEIDQIHYTHDLYVTASYTYFVPYQEGMITLYSIGTETVGGTSTLAGNAIIPTMTGQSGFKIGVGKHLMDGWDFMLNYLWFNNNPSLQERSLTAAITYSSPYEDLSNRLNTAQTQFINQFNKIDGCIEKTFYSGKSLTLRPAIGILGVFDTQYLNFIADLTAGSLHDIAHFQQHWWGAGPYGRIDTTFFFYKNIAGLFIRPGAGILYAKHEVKQSCIRHHPNGDAASAPINTSFQYMDVEPMVEIFLGLIAQINRQKILFRTEIGWEAQTYFSHNGFKTFYDSASDRGNYSMQGLTLALTIGF